MLFGILVLSCYEEQQTLQGWGCAALPKGVSLIPIRQDESKHLEKAAEDKELHVCWLLAQKYT